MSVRDEMRGTGMILQSKVAMVTGSGQGLGRGIAQAMAEQGAAIAVLEINPATARRTADELVGEGGRAIALPADVTQRADIDDAVMQTIAAFGRLDILVNAAIAAKHSNILFEENSAEDLALCYRSGFLGTINCMQACFPHLKVRGGAIVNFASISSIEGYVGSLSYASAKEAIRGATRVAAREWGPHNIRVNTVVPFGVAESAASYSAAQPEAYAAGLARVALGRAGDPRKDVGNAVAALASDLMAWVTGNTINIDGGMCSFS